MIRISEGEPPEIHQPDYDDAHSAYLGKRLKKEERIEVPPQQEQQQQQQHHHHHHHHQHHQIQTPQITSGTNSQKQVTKIIHRLERDPSIRAWCSVDNLLRQNALSDSQDDLSGAGLDNGMVYQPETRAISPPALFRGGVKEMAVDCGNVDVAERRGRFENNSVSKRNKQKSMNDVTMAALQQQNDNPVMITEDEHQFRHVKRSVNQNHIYRDNVVCLARRTLVSVGSEDSDYSVAESPYDRLARQRQPQANQQQKSTTNYPAAVAALNGTSPEYRVKTRHIYGSSSSSSASSGGGNGMLSRLSNFLSFGNSKSKNRTPVPC